MEHYLNAYLSTLKEKSKSMNTISAYRHDLQAFLFFLKTSGISSYSDIKSEHLKMHLDSLSQDGKSSSTVSRNTASLRSFLNYLFLEGIIAQNIYLQQNAKPQSKHLPETLSKREIEMLLNEPDVKDFRGSRDKAFLELLYATGMRITELVDLNISDVNLDMEFVRLAGKRQTRIIPLYPDAVDALSNYLNFRPCFLKAPDADEDAFFLNCFGKRMTRQGFWKTIKQYAFDAGINKKITPHMIRHSFAAHLFENGADLASLKEMLGHTDIASTKIYAKIFTSKVSETYKNCHPKSKQAN